MHDYFRENLTAYSPEVVEQYEYSDITLGNIMKNLLTAYKAGEYDNEGLQKMYSLIKVFKMVKQEDHLIK